MTADIAEGLGLLPVVITEQVQCMPIGKTPWQRIEQLLSLLKAGWGLCFLR